MNIIGTELPVIFPLFKKKTVTFDFVYILSTAYIEQLELFGLEL